MHLIHEVLPDILRIGASCQSVHRLIDVSSHPDGGSVIRRISAKPSIHIVRGGSRFAGHRRVHIKGTAGSCGRAVRHAAFQNIRHTAGCAAGINLFALLLIRHDHIAVRIGDTHDAGRRAVLSVVGEGCVSRCHLHSCGTFCETAQTGGVVFIIFRFKTCKVQIFQIFQTFFRSQFLIQTICCHIAGLLYRPAKGNRSKIGISGIGHRIFSCHSAVVNGAVSCISLFKGRRIHQKRFDGASRLTVTLVGTVETVSFLILLASAHNGGYPSGAVIYTDRRTLHFIYSIIRLLRKHGKL